MLVDKKPVGKIPVKYAWVEKMSVSFKARWTQVFTVILSTGILSWIRILCPINYPQK